MSSDFRAYPPKTEYPKEPYSLAADWIEKLWLRLENQEMRIQALEKALRDKNE